MTQLDVAVPLVPAARATPRGRLLDSLGIWMERLRRPRLMLVAVAVALYAPSLMATFVFDDYRNLRLMEEFQAGARPQLGLYDFIRNPEHNAALRARGELLWWIPDDLHFAYFRPLTERFLYLEFLAFGREPMGYHVASVALFSIGVCLVFTLLRRWGIAELTARWAALLFAVSSCNIMPLTFVASQCDMLALLGVLTALLAATNFAEGRGLVWLLLGVVCYAAALISKEAAVPAAVLPALMLVARSSEPRSLERLSHMRRTIVVTAAFVSMAAGLVFYHGMAGFGSNMCLMLDPIHSPGAYLRAMPLNAVALLSGWVYALNPVVFYLAGLEGWLVLYAIEGLAVIVPLLYWMRHRLAHERSLLAFALWPLPFLPVLACTVPDSRVMMLPTIGLSVLGAVWLVRLSGTRQVVAAKTRLRFIPFLCLIGFQLLAGGVTQTVDFIINRTCNRNMRTAVAGFERPTSAEDQIFFLNSHIMVDAVWARDRLLQLFGPDAPNVAHLSHLVNVEPEVIGPRTLRLRSKDVPFFESPMGRGTLTHPVVPVGWTSRMKEFTAIVREAKDGHVTAVDFEFAKPLDSPHYRFYFAVPYELPTRWVPTL